MKLKNIFCIEKVSVANKISSRENNYEYFIGYLYDNHKVRPLHIMLPKTSAYVNIYVDKLNGCIFWNEDDNLVEKFNAMWIKISADIIKRI